MIDEDAGTLLHADTPWSKLRPLSELLQAAKMQKYFSLRQW